MYLISITVPVSLCISDATLLLDIVGVLLQAVESVILSSQTNQGAIEAAVETACPTTAETTLETADDAVEVRHPFARVESSRCPLPRRTQGMARLH